MKRWALEERDDIWATIARLRIRSLDVLAPLVQDAARAALRECEGMFVTIVIAGRPDAIVIPLDVEVNETARTNELQRIYYQQGTSHAETAEKSWHFYRLALDNISRTYGWFNNRAAKAAWPDPKVRAIVCDTWFRQMAEVFKRHGFDAGIDWHDPDPPHVQWGTLSKSPHDAPRLFAEGGFEKVWQAVGAMRAAA